MHLPHLRWTTHPPPLPPYIGFAGAAKAFKAEDVQEDTEEETVWPEAA